MDKVVVGIPKEERRAIGGRNGTERRMRRRKKNEVNGCSL